MASISITGIDWTKVPTGGKNLDAGGYVMRVESSKEWDTKDGAGTLEVVYDVAEGACKDFFAGAEDWKHTMSVWAINKDGTPAGGMSQFLKVLEESNPQFKVEQFNNLDQLNGLLFGGIVQKELYTKRDGTDGWKMKVVKRCNVSDIRNGNYEVPAETDKRTNAVTTAEVVTPATVITPVIDGDAYADGDCPF